MEITFETMDSSTPSLDSCPVEILNNIYSYLPYNSLVNVTLSSWHHREIALPHLFRTLKVYDQSVQAFETGAYDYLVPYVRNVTFIDLVYEKGKSLDLVTKVIDRVHFIERFRRISGVHIFYIAPDACYWTIPLAMLRAMSVQPWYEELKSLTVDGLEPPGPPEGRNIFKWLQEENEETATERLFIDGLIYPCPAENLDIMWMSYPKQLESISINSSQPKNRQTYPFGDEAAFVGAEIAARAAKGLVKPGQLATLLPGLFLRHCHGTLKSVKMQLPSLVYPPATHPRQTYNFVRKLHMTFTSLFTRKDSRELGNMFPMVEDLRLDIDTRIQREHPAHINTYYTYFAGFPRLKRSRAPWPLPSWVNRDDHCLRWHVDCVGKVLTELEYMDFVHTVSPDPNVGSLGYLEVIRFRTGALGWEIWAEEI
ncbi:hypothetical protein AA313_de0205109 [Arthrobotrys entomopaga]|nr:hypothetical protein AA313_de0205109 [Arthrobotrys entomopaga]